MKTLTHNNNPIPQRSARPARWPVFVVAITTLFAAGVQAQVPVFSNVWNFAAGTVPGLPANNGNNCRGIAINPVTTNVLFFSSTGGTNLGANHVSTISFGGTYLVDLNGTGVSGGTLNTEGVRVADDGTVYGINLSGSPASSFKIYKWPSDSDDVTAPAVVANTAGNSFGWRVGDYSDLRGSGANTELIAFGNSAVTTNIIIYRPTDATCVAFTNFQITLPGGPASLGGSGVAFEGTNNAFWIRQNGSQNTRHIVYNPATLTAVCDRTNTVDQSACQGLKYYKANGVEMLATVQASSALNGVQIARVFQIPASPTAALISVLSSNLPVVTGSQNGNALGNVDAKNGYFIFGTPGHGISMFKLSFITNSPPNVTGPTGGGTFIEGLATNTITVTVSGTAPLRYQWFYTNSVTTNAVGSNTNFLTFSPVQLTNAGSYFVIVTNAFGAVTSGVVNLAVLPKGFSNLATQLWTLAPNSSDYLTGAGTDTQRGLAYDPIYQRLVMVSRAPTNGVHLLDAATGADQDVLDVSGISGGTFAMNMCGVADDGAVYVGNLCLNSGADLTYRIYRWDGATNTAALSLAFTGDLGIDRIGDTMAVRGAGTNTQILCGFRNTTNAAIFTTSDGLNFSFTLVAITNIPAGALGLSVTWGPGDTFWTKSDFNLRQVSYDLGTGVGNVLASYPVPTSETIVGVDNANGYAATIGTRETPQNLAIYDITTADGPSINTLVDRELFAASNPPGNATGSVAMDVAGGRIFALDSNSGILALTYAGRLAIAQVGGQQIVTWPTSASTLQSSTNVAGPYGDVSGATSPYTNSVGPVKFFRLKH